MFIVEFCVRMFAIDIIKNNKDSERALKSKTTSSTHLLYNRGLEEAEQSENQLVSLEHTKTLALCFKLKAIETLMCYANNKSFNYKF